MKKKICIKKLVVNFLLCLSLLFPFNSKASIFGEENATLIQILMQTIKQLYELQRIVQNGRDSLNLLRDINRGINDSMRIVDSLGPYIDPGTYKELRRMVDISRHLNEIYGVVVPNKDAQALLETDQVATEAIQLNNKMYDYAKELDRLGEDIKTYSHQVSPGGAQKLTAQSLGVLIHIQDQQLRATSTALKLSAQSLLVQNKEKKEATAEYLNQAKALKQKMKADNLNFEFPRF